MPEQVANVPTYDGPPPPVLPPLTPAQRARARILNSPALHFATCAKILDKRRNLVRPTPNILQIRMDQVYEVCQALKIPCKMIVLKPRQTGCSTKAAHTCYHHMRRYNAWGVEMADDLGNSNNLFMMFKRYAQTDEFNWGFNYTVTKKDIHFYNGEKGLAGSFMEQDTANNSKAGISATRQVLHLSEVAKYPDGGERDAYATISNMLASFNSNGPNSLAIAETTAEGASGWFYEHWMGKDDQPGAAWLEDFLDGHAGNGWIKVFAAWHEFIEHSLDRANPQDAEYFNDADMRFTRFARREAQGRQKYGWTAEQIAWRRYTVISDCGGDERIFDMHYPEDPETCFLASGTPRFDQEGMSTLGILAKLERVRYGQLNAPENDPMAISFAELDINESWFQLHEEPRAGYRYLAVVDNSEGSENQSGDDPDRHSAVIWRMACRDEEGRELPMRIAGRVIPPSYLDTDMLAAQMVKMIRYYGRCCTVVERNKGALLIKLLKDAGVDLYVQQRVDKVTSKMETYYGYLTDAKGRHDAIERLAPMIRDTTVDHPKLIVDAHTVKEFRTFVKNAKGRYEARAGCHDDDVMQTAIACCCVENATLYREKVRRRRQPADLYRWRRVGGKRR